ncbi:unnamed protein product [Heterotrigona itama]|uniref:Uncharacterized protein n=1 Tax=Heterotrigona itama TaxID=395501 RepID=A0A6V7H1L5_9HYME|nr:unnamed protein product [Heterotrigona itama]
MIPLQGNESVVPEGWPLTLGRRGLVLQLGELEASALRLGECYLCIRSSAAVATISGSGEAAAGETDERNTVEIAVVWRTTSMRAPGFLGWDREEEFMDWREVSRKGQGSTGAAGSSLQSSSAARSMMRPRRRSREEARSRTREQGCAFEHRREETRSIDRLECNSSNENRRRAASDTAADAGHAVMKSRSTSSVGTWKPTELLDASAETNGAFETASRPGSDHRTSSLSSDENRAGEVNKCAKVVSSMTMEKWKETARKIERVSLDDLTFPCPACRNIDTDDPLLGCRCAGDDCTCGNGEDACDCLSSANTRNEQSTRSFEIAGIKHIDSDDEEEVRMGFGE